MFRTIKFFSKFWGSLFTSRNYMRAYDKMIADGKTLEAYKYIEEKSAVWAKGLIESTGTNVELLGLENLPKEDGLVFVANHQSNFDIPLMLAYVPKLAGFIAKKELDGIPFLSKWMRIIGCVFIDRGNAREALKTIKEATDYVKDGKNMILFPEGTRSKGRKMLEFKQGGLRIATKAKAKIVPVTIDGSYKIYEGNGNRIKPEKVIVKFHQPIDTSMLEKDEIKALDNHLFDVIESGFSSER